MPFKIASRVWVRNIFNDPLQIGKAITGVLHEEQDS